MTPAAHAVSHLSPQDTYLLLKEATGSSSDWMERFLRALRVLFEGLDRRVTGFVLLISTLTDPAVSEWFSRAKDANEVAVNRLKYFVLKTASGGTVSQDLIMASKVRVFLRW